MDIAATISGKIQIAEQRFNVLNDTLNDLLSKDNNDADDTKRHDELLSQIDACGALLAGGSDPPRG
jgi:hypothetical protein